MKKSDFSGWKDVFAFSMEQGMKEKSFRIFLVIMFLVMLLASPVMTFFEGDDQPSTSIEKVLVFDETGFGIDYKDCLADDDIYKNVTVSVKDAAEYDSALKALEQEEKSATVLVKVAFNPEMGFDLTMVKTADSAFDNDEADAFENTFVDFFYRAKLTAVDVTTEQLDFMNRPIEVTSTRMSSDGVVSEYVEEEGISMDQYMVLLGAIMVVTLIISFSGSSISTSIITEKSTRVIEYLMINVRPMALLVGKILASLCLTLIQFLVIGIGYLGSKALTSALFGEGVKGGMEVTLMETLSAFSATSLIVALLIIVAGVLCFCIIAGLAGASASKMEEMQESMKLFQLSMIVGAYLGIFLCIMQLTGSVSSMLITVCCLIPIAAPFIAPINLLTGTIGMPVALISLAIVIVTAVLLFIFAARVYEAMIFHNGKVLKFKDIVGLAKAKKAGGKERQ